MPQESKQEHAERVKANLPLPEQPPVPSDWQSFDARNVNVGSGAVSADEKHSTVGLREPATKADPGPEELSRVGREGHDNLEGPPKDARAK
ncbi:hypothetical protein NKR19_g7403 [Coniochaeta hoffmannii]|uniref:Uncharacterized protein n=1 Tax=Coniochaeta hoffmannii TaxID=91930 RepID=A0AA38RAX5_9PEZI|nr:hypothetical protein NKR19_g7403 [Coniochaeta hoffmannii]